MKDPNEGYKFIRIDEKTHKLIKRLAKKNGRTIYGQVMVMTLDAYESSTK